MKVLLVQKIARLAGSEIYLLKLLPALRQQGIDAHFALLCDREADPIAIQYKQQLKDAGVPVFLFPVQNIPTLSQLRQINRHLVAQQYNLVHTHLLRSDITFALIKRLFHKKLRLVSTKHGYQESYNNTLGFTVAKRRFDPYRLISWLAETQFERSFAVSEALRRLYIGLNICQAKKIDVIYHGFDYPEIEPQNVFRYAPHQVVLVGRLTAFKGHRFAIMAMKTVVATYPDAKLVIVGEGPLQEELKALVQSLQLHDNVEFTGFLPNPRKVIADSDLLVLPSVAEAFGLVMLEAMATHKPIVAFRVPTPSEILTHGQTALLAEPFDCAELAAHIVWLLQHDEERRLLAANAYQLQKSRFTLSVMAQQTIRFYQKVLS